MKFVLFAFSMLLAGTAVAQDRLLRENPAVISFNGHTVVIAVKVAEGPPVPSSVYDRAEAICSSVDKSATVQASQKVGRYETEVVFLCE